MNKLFEVLILVISSIIMIFSLAFIVIEARLIFSLDWLAYDSPFMGCIRYLSRLIIALFVFSKSLLEITNINKENNKVKEYLYYFDFIYVLISIVIIFNSTNYVGIICVVLASINLLIKFISKK